MNRRCVFLSTRTAQRYVNYSEDEEDIVAYDLLPLEKISTAVTYCCDSVSHVCLNNEDDQRFFDSLTVLRQNTCNESSLLEIEKFVAALENFFRTEG